MTDPLEQLKRLVSHTACRVTSVDGKPITIKGTAFLVTARHALTCAHMVGSQSGWANRVTLHFSHGPSEVTARVLGTPSQELDVAVLVLESEVLDHADAVLPLLDELPGTGAPWYAFAHPRPAAGDGLVLSGHVADPRAVVRGRSVLQLGTKEARDSLQGASGAPVLAGSAIAGMLVRQLMGRDIEPVYEVAYAVRSKELRAYLRDLGVNLPDATAAERGVTSLSLQAKSVSTSRPPPPPRRMPRVIAYLDRQGDAVTVRFALPGGGELLEHTHAWSALAARLQHATDTLDGGDATALTRLLASASTELGETLFALLLGPNQESIWDALAAAVPGLRPAGASRPTPIRQAVHVHVVTRDPLLAALPWRLTAWDQNVLVDSGWRFTVGHEDGIASVHLSVPARVLLVAPGVPARAGATSAATARENAVTPYASHPQALADLLAAVWPTGDRQGYLHTVQTRAALERALADKPHLVYIHAATAIVDGEAYLLLAGAAGAAEPMPLAALERLFEQSLHRPYLVFLHTAGSAIVPPRLDGVPLVIWRRLPAWTSRSTELASDWLHTWLKYGADPVDALHHVSRDSGFRNDPDAATWIVRASYRTFTTPLFAMLPPSKDPMYLLDRDEPKGHVAKRVDDLVASPRRRAMAFVAYAEPGNHVDELWDQLRHHLDARGGPELASAWLHLELPPSFHDGVKDRRQLRDDLEQYLRAQLVNVPGAQGMDPNTQWGELFAACAPDAREARGGRVLWLEWGVCGTAHRQPPLLPVQLEAWLRFASELAPQCPSDLRVVWYVACETKNSSRLKDSLTRFLEKEWSNTEWFRLEPVTGVTVVERNHLIDYLLEYTKCAGGLQSELVALILRATGGKFEQVVALLRPVALRDGWYDLLERLRRERGPLLDQPQGDDGTSYE